MYGELLVAAERNINFVEREMEGGTRASVVVCAASEMHIFMTSAWGTTQTALKWFLSYSFGTM